MNKQKRLLTIALILIIAGSVLAGWINAGAGKTTVKDVRYVDHDGVVIFARLYIPDGVDSSNPAPGVLVIHGGDASNEIMSNIALELARAGFVTLNMDQPGAGQSDYGSDSRGAPANALQYLRSLDIVDEDNVGLLGHSMGGSAACGAITQYPDDYQAIFFLDTNCRGEIDIRNQFVNWGLFEEHPSFFMQVTFNDQVTEAPMLYSMFKTDEPITPEVTYGSVEDGTAYRLGLTHDTHLTVDDSPAVISNAVYWFNLTLKGEDAGPSGLIYGWKTLGTFAAFVGMMLLVFPVGSMLLETSYFKSLTDPVPAFKGFKGSGWWIAAIVTAVLVPLTYVYAWDNSNNWGFLDNRPLWPQGQTNHYYLGWAVVLGAITLILIVANHFLVTRKQGAKAHSYGLVGEGGGIEWSKIGKSFLLAILIFVPAYLLLSFTMTFCKVDWRLNFLSIRALSPVRVQVFLAYLIPFLAYYLVIGVMVHGFLRINKGEASSTKETLANVAIMMGGLLVWMIVWYISLYSTGQGFIGTGTTNYGIRALPLMVVLPFVATMSTYFFRKTGRVYVGAFLAGTFVTWYLAANSIINVMP